MSSKSGRVRGEVSRPNSIGLEPLDERVLPAVTHVSDVLNITGTPHADKIVVDRVGDTLIVTLNGKSRKFDQANSKSAIHQLSIASGAGNDTVTITDRVDSIKTSIDGGTGDDSIQGGIGDDTIEGGSGDDTIEGGGGDDSIDPGSGSDQVDGGPGNNTEAATEKSPASHRSSSADSIATTPRAGGATTRASSPAESDLATTAETAKERDATDLSERHTGSDSDNSGSDESTEGDSGNESGENENSQGAESSADDTDDSHESESEGDSDTDDNGASNDTPNNSLNDSAMRAVNQKAESESDTATAEGTTGINDERSSQMDDSSLSSESASEGKTLASETFTAALANSGTLALGNNQSGAELAVAPSVNSQSEPVTLGRQTSRSESNPNDESPQISNGTNHQRRQRSNRHVELIDSAIASMLGGSSS